MIGLSNHVSLAQSQDTVEVKNFSRGRLKSLMGECKALLDSLGISSVKAEGNYFFDNFNNF